MTLERAVGSTDSTFAVDHERELVVAARDASEGAKLAERQGEVAGGVRGDRERLTHDVANHAARIVSDSFAVAIAAVIAATNAEYARREALLDARRRAHSRSRRVR